MTIRNPVVWGWDQVRNAAATVDSVGHAERHVPDHLYIHRVGIPDIRYALENGLKDFSAHPSHYLFLCALYPLLGLILARIISGADVVPLLFPLVSGFALIGPLAAVGIFEISRRAEAGEDVSWTDAFGVLRSPALGQIIKLAAFFAALFLVWLLFADLLYRFTLGPDEPQSFGGFLRDVFTTGPGWVLLIVGNAIGFLFAVAALVVGAVSFQAIVDHQVSAEKAIRTSLRAARANPVTFAVWGICIAVILAIGSIPLLLGLAVAIPVLGHASWHFYRRVVTV